jgi:hypothetical protein
MRELGRRGGLRGGVARAKALSATRKAEIARGAAEARWKPSVLVLSQPKDHGELQWFVAQYGNGHALASSTCDPAAVLLRAVSACRNDGGLAKMLPVFIWRARDEIFAHPKRLLAVSPEEACALGYFLELTCRFSRSRLARSVLPDLRRKSKTVKDPVFFFHLMSRSMLMEFAEERTSALAKSWNLVLGEPDDSFESYFTRAERFARAAL